VIKMAMAMREGVMPRSLHAEEPTPHVDWEAGAVELLAEAQPWERGERPRRAGISSFGISGTNAHLILEEVPAEPEGVSPSSAYSRERRHTPVVLSAKSEPALRDQAKRLVAHLQANPEQGLDDTAFSLATARAQLSHRAGIVAADGEELLEALGALASGKPHPSLVEAKTQDGKLAFLLSGQGAQRPGMGRGLYEAFPVYAEALEEACEELDPHLGLSLKDLLFAEKGSEEAAKLDRTEITQPALFATGLSLHRLLESFGYQPDFLLGHSIGELTAAHLAGVFDLSDAAKLICARGALMGALPEGGAMAAIEATEEEIEAGGLPGGVSLAGVNGPMSLVLSGPEQEVMELAEQWKGKGRRTARLKVSHAFHSFLMDPMLAELEQVASGIALSPPKLTVLSNLTGQPLTPEQATDPAYWAAQVRSTVRFADGVAHLAEQGVGVCLELGPGANLCAAAGSTFAHADSEAVAIPTLGKDAEEPRSLLTAIASAHARGASPDWATLFPNARRVPLPTYAFQRERYWLEPVDLTGDASAIGQGASEHPLLGAVISLPGDAGWLLTGRLSLRTHAWLGDHRIHGAALLPGTAFVEMALEGARLAGASQIAELTIEAPLILPDEGAMQVQLSVGAVDEEGRRPISIHSRPEREDEEGEWTANAAGLLDGAAPAAAEPLAEWPPVGAEPMAVFPYELGSDFGAEYGPAFQGVRQAWRRGSALFAEVELSEGQRPEADLYRVHPALLDAALHPALVAAGETEGADGPSVPFAWRGVSLRRPGATELRVAIWPSGEDVVALQIADAEGEPLIAVEALVSRPIPSGLAADVARDAHRNSLFELEWVEPAPASFEQLVETEAAAELPGDPFEPLALAPDPALDPASAAAALAAEALRAVQETLAAGEQGRLAFLTTGAVAALAGESPDPAAAAVWGLVRAAQAEHPGRFLLIDSDGSEASAAALEALLAEPPEPQLALREGTALLPRLARTAGRDGAEGDAAPAALDPERTVLVTGASGGLGAVFARHLAAAHGARHLLLASRRGESAPGAAELRAELEALGAAVTVAACDVGDRSQLADLLAAIPAEHPLGAVFHAAGVLDDGVVEAQSPERLATAFGPKAGAAWHLHELTAGAELSDFVLFSSAAATFGSPGQANYAAANSFLDALAQRRAAAGLPASSIGWGPWAADASMTGDLRAADLARMERAGARPFEVEEGLELFERLRGHAFAVAAPVDLFTLRSLARAGELAPIFSGLVKMPAVRATAGSFPSRLAAVPEPERQALAIALVAEHVAAVLGHRSAAAINPKAAFKNLGFDSLAAVELRNRLGAATGLRLSSTLVFDYPTAEAVAGHLLDLVGDGGAKPDLDRDLDHLLGLLESLTAEEKLRTIAQLQTRLTAVASEERGEGEEEAELDLETASDEEIMKLIDAGEVG
jgi:pimaricinolide synthase PimS1